MTQLTRVWRGNRFKSLSITDSRRTLKLMNFSCISVEDWALSVLSAFDDGNLCLFRLKTLELLFFVLFLLSVGSASLSLLLVVAVDVVEEQVRNFWAADTHRLEMRGSKRRRMAISGSLQNKGSIASSGLLSCWKARSTILSKTRWNWAIRLL